MQGLPANKHLLGSENAKLSTSVPISAFLTAPRKFHGNSSSVERLHGKLPIVNPACKPHLAHPTRCRVASAEPAPVQLSVPLSFEHRHGVRDNSGNIMLKNLTMSELEEWCMSVGEPARRSRQLFKVLYGNNRWIQDLDEVDGDAAVGFSAAFKRKVAAGASLSGGLRLQQVHTARDGTHKLVFDLVPEEGGATGTVETVLIPMTNKQGGNLRYTACLSTQVGCAMNCQFCYTGRMGLLGNLSTAQVVEQVIQARRWLAEQAAISAASAAQSDNTNTNATITSSDDTVLQGIATAMSAVSHIDAESTSTSTSAHSSVQTTSGGSPPSSQEEEGEVVGALSLLAEDYMASASPQTPPQMHIDDSSSQHHTHQQAAVPSSKTSSKQGKNGAKPIPISNIVFMGMGEPLHNYDVVMSAIDILAEGLELSRSKIIVSTVGLADAMRTFLASNKAKLALSLHATTDEVRDWIVPTNRRHNIAELMSVLKQHFPAGSKGDKFVVLEYVLLAGVNDTLEDAHRLVELTKEIYCMINLIVFNPHDGTPFKKSSEESAKAFRKVLMNAGRVCTIRMSKGDDEMAACGQLGNPGQAKKPVPVVAPPAALKDLLAGAAAMQAAKTGGTAAATATSE